MATKKKPAAGAGRKAGSEPRLQVFKAFTGVNFQHSAAPGLYDKETDSTNPEWGLDSKGIQTDLIQTYMAIQDNASCEEGTIEARDVPINVYPELGMPDENSFMNGETLDWTEVTPYYYTGVNFLYKGTLFAVAAYDYKMRGSQDWTHHEEVVWFGYTQGGEYVPCRLVFKGAVVPGVSLTDTRGSSDLGGIYGYTPSNFTFEYNPGDNFYITQIALCGDKLVVNARENWQSANAECNSTVTFWQDLSEFRYLMPGSVCSVQREWFIPTTNNFLFQIESTDIGFSTGKTDVYKYEVRFKYAPFNVWGSGEPQEGAVVTGSTPTYLKFWTDVPFTEVVDGRADVKMTWTYRGSNISADQAFKIYNGIQVWYTAEGADEFLLFFRDSTGVTATGNTWKFEINTLNADADGELYLWGDLDVPEENLSAGPECAYVEWIDGRAYWYCNDIADPAYGYHISKYGRKHGSSMVWIGANNSDLYLNVTRGGGYVDCDPGTGNVVLWVGRYKTQSGANIVTALCKNPNYTRSYRYNLVEQELALSNTLSTRNWKAERVSGAIGAESHGGCLVAADGLYTVDRWGLALTTMAMEYNSQIAVKYVSDPVKQAFTAPHIADSKLLYIDGKVIYCPMNIADRPPDSYVDKAKALVDDLVESNHLIWFYDINAKAWWTNSVVYDSVPQSYADIPSDFEAYGLDWWTRIVGIDHYDYEVETSNNNPYIQLSDPGFYPDYDETTWQGHGVIVTTPFGIFKIPMDGTVNPWINTDDGVTRRGLDVSPLKLTTRIESGELGTMQPLQSVFRLTKLEFNFDYIEAIPGAEAPDMVITIDLVDKFGRVHKIQKTHSEWFEDMQYPLFNWQTHMRIDEDVRSWRLTIETTGLRYRLVDFIASVYPRSNRNGIWRGFDDVDMLQYRKNNPEDAYQQQEFYAQRYFKSYDDVQRAIIT